MQPDRADLLKLFSRTADGVFAIDAEDRIILWNRSAEEILGFSSTEVLGKFCYEVLPGRDPAGNLFCYKGCSVMTMAGRGQLVRNYDAQVMTKTGEKVWLNISILMMPVSGRGRPLIVHSFRRSVQPERNEKLAEQVALNVLSALKTGDPMPGAQEALRSPGISSLTRRETEILMLLSKSMGTKEIADHFCVSRSTVRTHIQNILENLGVHSKLEAVTLLLRQGLFQNECAGRSCQPGRFPALREE